MERLREAGIDEPRVHNDRIALVAYDPEWPRLFHREAERIRNALGERVLRIEHVGSTSVPELIAKPFVDMVLEVDDSADETAYVHDLESAGYVLRIRETKWHEHRLFTNEQREIKLHVFGRGCSETRRMLIFRDRLRSNADDAKSEVIEAIFARAEPDQRRSGTPDG